MQKIIKKSVELDEPVVISGEESNQNTNAETGSGRQSLAFTEIINDEIKNWKEKAVQQENNRKKTIEGEVEKAYQEGYDKGLTDGIQQERDDSMKSIDALLKEAKKKSKDAIHDLEVKIIELAVNIAERLTRKSIQTDPSITENIVAETMSHIIGSEKVVLKVSGDDFNIINDKYNNWLSMAGNAAEFRIEIDKRLRTGDYIVETEGGVIDSLISDRIDVLVEELLKASRKTS